MRQRQWARGSFRDRGAGFKPFVTNKQGGTGLGLAIVHKIVSQHGGRVRLCARPDGGTAAELLIPS